MADFRVHPASADPLPAYSSASTSPETSGEYPKLSIPPVSKPIPPPPSSYVVQLPREQIFRYPPQENARKFQTLPLHKNRRSCCRRCCCFTVWFLFVLIIASAASAGVLYLVFRFKSPKYTIISLTIRGMNLTSASPISPIFYVSVRAENPNEKMSIHYLKGSAVNVFFNDVKLNHGVLPAFYQPAKNFTVIRSTMEESDVVLGGAVKTALNDGENQRNLPFVIRLKAPVKFKVGAAKTWDMIVEVQCDVVLDALTEKASIVHKKCHNKVRLWKKF